MRVCLCSRVFVRAHGWQYSPSVDRLMSSNLRSIANPEEDEMCCRERKAESRVLLVLARQCACQFCFCFYCPGQSLHLIRLCGFVGVGVRLFVVVQRTFSVWFR